MARIRGLRGWLVACLGAAGWVACGGSFLTGEPGEATSAATGTGGASASSATGSGTSSASQASSGVSSSSGSASASSSSAASTGTGGVVNPCPGSTDCVDDFVGHYNMIGDKDGVGSAALFNGISGITGDGADTLWVASNHTVRQIAIGAQQVTTIAGQPGVDGDDSGKTGTDCHFGTLGGIAFYSGAIYVADSSYRRVKKIDLGSKLCTYFTGDGSNGMKDGSFSQASFSAPGALTFFDTSLGYFYVADAGIIRTVSKIGDVTTVVPNPAFPLKAPGGITVSFDKNTAVTTLAITDSSANVVDLLTGNGNVWSGAKACGTGEASYLEGACDTVAKFNAPAGITRRGNIAIVADSNNNRLRQADAGKPNVPTQLLAGEGSAASQVGVGPKAKIDHPTALYLRVAQPTRLFIVEAKGTKIRMMELL